MKYSLPDLFGKKNKKHREKYAEYLSYEHRDFDVKGLTTTGIYTLGLAEVFVELGLSKQTLDRASADPLRPSSNSFRQKRDSVWSYLASQKSSDPPIIILGAPGSGKTTLLKHLAISLAPRKNNVAITLGYRRLPIFLALRDYAEQIKARPDFSVFDALRLKIKGWLEFDVPQSWFNEQLNKGQCLIMLDGLDEVADDQMRIQVVAWVEKQIKKYAGNRFVITSRPFGYRSNPLGRGLILETQPFNIEQVNKFVHNWYFANEVMSNNSNDLGVRMKAQSDADDLLFRLRRAHVLLDMAVNPLLLTMIATVHRYRGSLPGRRVELYAEICEVFLGKRQRARGIAFDLTPAQKRRVLQSLAYRMMCGEVREIGLADAVEAIQGSLSRVSPDISGELFLEMITNESGLLVEREVHVYGFAHLTFQEYLTAVHIQEGHKLEAELIRRVEDSWWHETIRLYTAQGDASNIVLACVSRDEPSIIAWQLAVECLGEAREIKPKLRELGKKIDESVDNPKPKLRHFAANVKLRMRLGRMMRIDEDKYVDTTFVTHAEYQLFLDDMRLADKYYQPDHWMSYTFRLGNGRLPILGIRPNDAVAFCEWLTDRESGGWQYRLPKRNELLLLEQDRDKETAVSGSGSKEAAAQKIALGFWFTVAKRQDIQCSKFNLPEPSQIKLFLQQIKRRFYADCQELAPLKFQATALDVIQKRAKNRQFTLHNMDRNLQLDRLDLPDIAHHVNQVRERGLTSRIYLLSEKIQHAHSIEQNVALGNAFRPLDKALKLSEQVNKELAYALGLGTVAKLAQTLHNNLEQAHTHARKRDMSLRMGLFRPLNNAFTIVDELVLTMNEARKEMRKQVRINGLGHIDDLLQQLEMVKVDGKMDGRDRLRQQLMTYVDVYLDFVLLEERFEQKMPCFEGIRIVKEQKPLVSAD